MVTQSTSYFGTTAISLVKEAIRSRESPGLPVYRDDLIRSILLEMKHLYKTLSDIDATSKTLDDAGPLDISASMHKMALHRNKRCVLAYQRSRIDCLVYMLWASGGASTASSLPEQVARYMSQHETEFMHTYRNLASDYRGQFLDIDIGAALIPPRDVFIEIRVVQDCGEILTENGPVKLSLGSQAFMKRCDVQDLLLSGHLKHIQ